MLSSMGGSAEKKGMSLAAPALVRALFKRNPGLLAGEGVTLDQVVSFAEAAASFARAEPWWHLDEEADLIHVEAPEAGWMLFAFVLGSAGMERGVLVLPEPREPREMADEDELDETSAEEPWLLRYVASSMIPAQDLYLWERHGLALAGKDSEDNSEDKYPLVSTPREDNRLPDTQILDRFETILRALAVTTEDEMDSGLWEKTVETGRGPVRLVLSLPDLLYPSEPDWDDELEDVLEEVPESPETPETPEITAQVLADQAWDATGRRRVALARRALALWPYCVDAWILLAERERDPERSVSLYSRAMEAAERALDPLLFEKHAGDFWEIPETRPYMQARLGLAEALWEAGRCEEAVEHFQELLRLNPMNDQGVRNRLVDALLLLDRDREAARILDAHPDEILAHSLYSRTLLAFRREGDSPGARNCLTLALARNRFVPEYLVADGLLAEEVLPLLLRLGDRSEAVAYAVAAYEVWESTPGALGWLRDRVSTRRKARSRGGKPRKKRKGRR
jgi:tetratricopeptide (TPR) repeat protein